MSESVPEAAFAAINKNTSRNDILKYGSLKSESHLIQNTTRLPETCFSGNGVSALISLKATLI